MTDNIVAIMNQRIEDRDAQQNPLACSLKEAAISVKFATLALRSCYSRNDSSIQEFRELRSGVTNAASVYTEQVLPVAKMSLQKVREFMENFSLLNCEQCLEIADEIAEDAGKCEDLMRLNFDTHEAMAAEFKQFDVDVERAIAKCALEKRRYDEQAKELAASADKKRLRALGLAVHTHEASLAVLTQDPKSVSVQARLKPLTDSAAQLAQRPSKAEKKRARRNERRGRS